MIFGDQREFWIILSMNATSVGITVVSTTIKAWSYDWGDERLYRIWNNLPIAIWKKRYSKIFNQKREIWKI